MKSKISFFNKTIFWKNVTLYWPIWLIYTLYLIGVMPFLLWLNTHDRFDTEPYTDKRMIRMIYLITQPQMYTIVIAGAAVIAGMALFSYLYKSQSANMIHSLPVDRTELFGTNVISGLAFLIVPQIVTFVLTTLICLAEGITKVEYLGMWLLYAMATAFISFSFVTICAFFTGQLVAMPIYVIAINSLAYIVSSLISVVTEWFGYGVDGSALLSSDILLWFSPLVNYMANVDTDYFYSEGREVIGIQMSGIECILIYLAVAIVLYVLAFFVYRRRKIEQAGDLITVEMVKPIFRFGVGIVCGFYVTLFFTALFTEIGYEFTYFGFSVGLLIFGIVFYFIADMFVRKTFHVFKKKNLKGCGMFCVVLVVSFVALAFYANMEEKFVPKENEISYVNLSMGYSGEYEGTDLAEILEIHKRITENADEYQKLERKHENDYYSKSEGVTFVYHMKNGNVIRRQYQIPNWGEGKEIIASIRKLEEKPTYFLESLLGPGYASLDRISFSYSYVELEKMESIDSGKQNVVDVSCELTSTQAKQLYQAIIADGMEGRLNKYNSYYSTEGSQIKGMTYYIHMEVLWQLQERSVSTIYAQSTTRSYVDLQFGKDCNNIIQTIVELGIGGIMAPEEIYWGE